MLFRSRAPLSRFRLARQSTALAAGRFTLRASSTLDRLDHETRVYHADADAPWLALMSADICYLDYRAQLEITYGFEASLEGAYAYTVGLDTVIAVRERFRAGLIAQDLLALGLTPAELARLPQCFAITPFAEIGETLGWMYVVERSTLLHNAVRRAVLQRIPEARHATAYLCAAGSVAGVRWQEFGVALDRFAAANEGAADRVVEAAEHAFHYWLDWLDYNRSGELRTG